MGRPERVFGAAVLTALLACKPAATVNVGSSSAPAVRPEVASSAGHAEALARARAAQAAGDALAQRGEEEAARSRYRSAAGEYRAAVAAMRPGPEQVDASRALVDCAEHATGYEYPRWKYSPRDCTGEGLETCNVETILPRPATLEESELLEALKIHFRVAEAAGQASYPWATFLATDVYLMRGDPETARDMLYDLLYESRGVDDVTNRSATMLLLEIGASQLQDRSQAPLDRDLYNTFTFAKDLPERRGWRSESPEAGRVLRFAREVALASARLIRQMLCKPPACWVSEDILQMQGREHADAPVLLYEAGLIRRNRGETADAIRLLNELLERFPGDPRAAEVPYILAEIYANVLNYEDARDQYAKFVRARAGEAKDERVRHARQRWISLAYSTRRLDPATVDRLFSGGAEERALAVAVRFRAATIRRDLNDAGDVEGYLEQHGREGGAARAALAHVIAAGIHLRLSCPPSVGNLCVEVDRGSGLGRALARRPRALDMARRHIRAAEELLRGVSEPVGQFGPPLDVEADELLAARLELAFIKGDLSAESALAKRPPASYESTRTREWLTRRTEEVDAMAAAYEGVLTAYVSTADQRYVARSAARQGQVCEADSALLAEVAEAVAREDGGALQGELRRRASERRRRAFRHYGACLRAIAAWGNDGDGLGEVCRSGLGRIVGRYERLLEYSELAVPQSSRPELEQ